MPLLTSSFTYKTNFSTISCLDKILLLCDKINNMSFEQLSKFYNSDSIKEKLDKNFNTIKYWKNPYNQKNEVELFLGEHI